MLENNSIRRAVDHSLAEYFRHLGNEAQPRAVFRLIVDEAEAAVIANIMARCHGNQSKAAQMLGITRNTLKSKLIAYQLL